MGLFMTACGAVVCGDGKLTLVGFGYWSGLGLGGTALASCDAQC